MIRRNIAANITARAWGVISGLLFYPAVYLKFLGIEAYGLMAVLFHFGRHSSFR